MIGYYIHHHGRGHHTRAAAICSHLNSAVTALSSTSPDPGAPFTATVLLDRDDRNERPGNATAGGALHWAPIRDDGLRVRMTQVADWIDAARPRLLVVDVSVEMTAFARLFGIPVVVVAMPGARTDSPHRLGYQLAEHIIAAWPQNLYDPAWLRTYAHKTSFVGGISRFDRRAPVPSSSTAGTRILVLSGAGGSALTHNHVAEAAHAHRRHRWRALGIPGTPWVADPWPALSGCDVVVSHAGQNAIADIAVAARPAIIIGQPRPFGEQAATADALSRHRLAVTIPHWPRLEQWPELLDRAHGLGGERWVLWQTSGAAERAAAIIDSLAKTGEVPR